MCTKLSVGSRICNLCLARLRGPGGYSVLIWGYQEKKKNHDFPWKLVPKINNPQNLKKKKKKNKKVMHIDNLNLSIFQSFVYNIPLAKSVEKLLSQNNKKF